MTNQDMFVSIDEDTLDQVSGGCLPCINPCAILGQVVGAAECLVGGAEKAVEGLLCALPSISVSASIKIGGHGC